MPRHKKYDEDDVLEKAMEAFWHHGYEATSMKTLVDCMGLNPGSIYAAFGSKKTLFEKTLTHYEDQTSAKLAELEKNRSPQDAIFAVFDHMVEDVQSKSDNCGCFLVNSILEADPKDKTIARAVKRGLDKFEGFMSRMIEKGQASGEIGKDLDPQRTARLLNGLLAGARVMSRGHGDVTILKDVAAHARKILS